MESQSVPFRTVAVLGTGLMGGSLAGALKGLTHPPRIVGTSRNPVDAEGAMARGWIDALFPSNARCVAGADLVVVAVPPGEVESVWTEIVPGLSPEAVVTDLSSVKGALFGTYSRGYAERLPLYTSSHPMAGSERTGMEAARADLFRGRTVFLTPFSQEKGQTPRLAALWQALGAKTTVLTPSDHDGIVAFISHLPHVLAYSLLHLVERMRAEKRFENFDYMEQKGGSFSDILRIAKSSPSLWADIFSQNRSAILEAIDLYQGEIDLLREAIASLSPGELSRLLSEWAEPALGVGPA
ncbi:MAG: prephenate dehydrogenase [Leptospirillia bacterium]